MMISLNFGGDERRNLPIIPLKCNSVFNAGQWIQVNWEVQNFQHK